jgi:hypothetical protein
MGGGNLGLEADGQEDTGDEREDVCAGQNPQKSKMCVLEPIRQPKVNAPRWLYICIYNTRALTFENLYHTHTSAMVCVEWRRKHLRRSSHACCVHPPVVCTVSLSLSLSLSRSLSLSLSLSLARSLSLSLPPSLPPSLSSLSLSHTPHKSMTVSNDTSRRRSPLIGPKELW